MADCSKFICLKSIQPCLEHLQPELGQPLPEDAGDEAVLYLGDGLGALPVQREAGLGDMDQLEAE